MLSSYLQLQKQTQGTTSSKDLYIRNIRKKGIQMLSSQKKTNVYLRMTREGLRAMVLWPEQTKVVVPGTERGESRRRSRIRRQRMKTFVVRHDESLETYEYPIWIVTTHFGQSMVTREKKRSQRDSVKSGLWYFTRFVSYHSLSCLDRLQPHQRLSLNSLNISCHCLP